LQTTHGSTVHRVQLTHHPVLFNDSVHAKCPCTDHTVCTDKDVTMCGGIWVLKQPTKLAAKNNQVEFNKWLHSNKHYIQNQPHLL